MKALFLIPAAALLTLAACHDQEAASPSGAVSATATAAPAPSITVSQARLVLPAVKGNPGAAYFTLRNDTDAPVTLVRIDIAGAQSAQMHETSGGTMRPLQQVRIGAHSQVSFAPGSKHVMVFGLASRLIPGAAGHIVADFQAGNASAAPLRIEAAGGGSDDMGGMNMGGKP